MTEAQKDTQGEEFYFDYVRLLVENRLLQRSGYYLGASNDYARIFTITARRYWIAQAMSEHLTTDWKVHFSVRPRDIPLAFNLLSELYYEMKLPVGLKARFPDYWKDYENVWPKHMRGREITVYILLYENTLTQRQTMLYSRDDLTKPKHMIDWTLPYDKNIYEMHDLTRQDEVPLERYFDYVIQAEKLLEQHKIESNGCADGDYPIGKYTSLRNEKFVAIADENGDVQLKYPPNECGFNGSFDNRDLTKEIIDLKTYEQRKKQRFFNKILCLSLTSCFLIVLLVNFFS